MSTYVLDLTNRIPTLDNPESPFQSIESLGNCRYKVNLRRKDGGYLVTYAGIQRYIYEYFIVYGKSEKVTVEEI